MLHLDDFLSLYGTVFQWIRRTIIQFISGNTAVVVGSWTEGFVDLLQLYSYKASLQRRAQHQKFLLCNNYG